MPVVLAAMNLNGNGHNCCFCGACVGLQHILIHCVTTLQLHQFVELKANIPRLVAQDWIFGHPSQAIQPIIWLVNFVV